MFARFAWSACLIGALGAPLACAPRPELATVQRLSKRIARLSRQMRRQQQAFEDLASRLVVLQDRVDANRVALSRRASAPAPRPSPRPAARPTPRPRPRAVPRAARRERRRLPVVKLRAGRSPTRRSPARGGKTIVLKLTGRPDPRSAVGRSGRSRAPLPMVGERLPVVAMPGAPVRRGGVGPEVEYRQARALFKKRGYAAASQVFSRVARQFPKHALADNATYWLAECFYRQGKVRRAAWVLRKLLKRYPSGNKAPSAMLKLALCEGRLGRRGNARKVLAQVMQLYPGSREARLAAARLKRLR